VRHLLVLGAEVRVGRGDALELDERAEPRDGVQMDPYALPQEQVARLVDDDERAQRRVERGAQHIGLGHRRQPVAALARVRDVGPVVLDQGRAAGLLLAQLQPPGARAEVRVALAEDAFVVRTELAADGERPLRVGVDRLQLDVAAGR
jgi:hypothetical protein